MRITRGFLEGICIGVGIVVVTGYFFNHSNITETLLILDMLFGGILFLEVIDF